jgi:hypothetical protein
LSIRRVQLETSRRDEQKGRLPRSAAKRTYALGDRKEQTARVECRKDEGVLDEIPGAYKSIDAVMAAQPELVDVVDTLRQVGVYQGVMCLPRAGCSRHPALTLHQ